MDIGCNRLENAVKPQPNPRPAFFISCCNRLENAVKPQQRQNARRLTIGCNRLENAVKPQPIGGLPDECKVL